MKPTRAEMRLANQHAHERARKRALDTLKSLKNGPLAKQLEANGVTDYGDRVCALVSVMRARVHADTPSGTRNPDARTA